MPAFFGDWFMERVRQGFFYQVNPYNSGLIKGYSLAPEDVDAIGFFTKNPRPFLKHLDALDGFGYRYYFHFTLNGYPAVFEPNLPPLNERIETFQELSRRIGRNRIIWRYDPIIISSVTGEDYHLEMMARIAEQLRGFTDRVYISLLDFYAKVKKNFKIINQNEGISFIDLAAAEYRDRRLEFMVRIREIAAGNEMLVLSCAEKADLREAGIEKGSCIDGKLIRELWKIEKEFPKDPNQRKECFCAKAVDLGAYNTCSFKCAYCYANAGKELIESNLRRHRMDGALLIGDYSAEVEIVKDRERKQLPLF
ncbi:MAG: DUF1848 domain-containing protein [Bacillota bacterium]